MEQDFPSSGFLTSLLVTCWLAVHQEFRQGKVIKECCPLTEGKSEIQGHGKASPFGLNKEMILYRDGEVRTGF